MQARKCRKRIYVFTFLSVTVRKAKFRRKFLSHILKPCGRHRADSESVACHVPCVFGVTVITVILGKCVRGGGKTRAVHFCVWLQWRLSFPRSMPNWILCSCCCTTSTSHFWGAYFDQFFLRLSSWAADCADFSENIRKSWAPFARPGKKRKEKGGVFHTVFIHFPLRRSCSHLPRPAD